MSAANRTTPPDLTSTSRLRAKKYAAAHAVYITKKQACKLVVVRDPSWAALRSKGPLITLDNAHPHHVPASRRQSRTAGREKKKEDEDWLIAQLVDRVSGITAGNDVIHEEEEEEEEEVEEVEWQRSPNQHTKLEPTSADNDDMSPSANSIFLTGTYLVNTSPAVPILPPPSLTLDDLDLERYFAEFRMPAVPAWDAPLPSDIASTARLLRLAVYHPAHYWKVTAPRFAKPTHAAQVKARKAWKRVYLDGMYKMEAAAEAERDKEGRDKLSAEGRDLFDSRSSVTSGKEGCGNEGGGGVTTDAEIELEAALKDDPGLRSPAHSEWSDASLAELPSARALGSVRGGGAGAGESLLKKQSREIRSFVGAVPATSKANRKGGKGVSSREKGGGGGLLKMSNATNSLLATKVKEPKDGMDEVRVLMKKVHYKLQLLESELARINTEESRKKRERALLRAGGSRMLFAPGAGGVELGGSRLSFAGGSKMNFQSKLSLNAAGGGGGGLDLSGWSGGGGGAFGAGLLGVPGIAGSKGKSGGGGSTSGLSAPHAGEVVKGKSVGSLTAGDDAGVEKRKLRGAGGLEVNLLGMS